MKCLIIDADKKSRTSLQKVLKSSTLVSDVYTCAKKEQALNIALENDVDVIFANLAKPGDNGIGFLVDIPYPHPELVITSEMKEVAQDAFDHEAIDFLLKPITPARVMKTIARVIKHDGKSRGKVRNYDHLFIKMDGNLQKVDPKEIYMMESSFDYIIVYTAKKDYTVYTTFQKLMNNLSSKDFMRIHRSYIVRLDHISSIEDNMVKVGKHLIPVSNTYRQALMDRLKIL